MIMKGKGHPNPGNKNSARAGPSNPRDGSELVDTFCASRSSLPLIPLIHLSPWPAARGEGGLKRGFAAGGEAVRRETPFLPPPLARRRRPRPATRRGLRRALGPEGLGLKGLSAEAPLSAWPKGLRPESERERGTNDSGVLMNLGAGGGVSAAAREALPRDRATDCRNHCQVAISLPAGLAACATGGAPASANMRIKSRPPTCRPGGLRYRGAPSPALFIALARSPPGGSLRYDCDSRSPGGTPASGPGSS